MPTKNFTAAWVESINWGKALKEWMAIQEKKPEAKKAKVQAQQIDYLDTTSIGDGIQLGLRVGKRHKTWFAMYRNKQGKVKRYTIEKRFPKLGYSDAREAAKTAVIKFLTGKDPAKEKQDNKSAPTFTDLADLYINKEAKIKKKSWGEDQRRIDKHLLPTLAGEKVHEIRGAHIQIILDDIQERAPIEANRTFALIRRMFNWALKRPEFELLEFNPCAKIHMPSQESQRDRVLNFDEIQRLWHAYGELQPNITVIFQLLFLTAQREIEVLSMRWEDIDFSTQWWTIPKHVTKNKLPHRVPLTADAIQILKNQKAYEDEKREKRLARAARTSRGDTVREGVQEWVFPSNSMAKKPHVTNLIKSHYKAKEQAGISDCWIHDIRRTVASTMTSEHIGTPRLVVSKILNHKEKGVTAVYDRHSYDADKRKALDKWNNLLKRIVAGKFSNVVSMVR